MEMLGTEQEFLYTLSQGAVGSLWGGKTQRHKEGLREAGQ